MKTPMTYPAASVYGFGDFRLYSGKRLLTGCNGKPVALTPKAYDTLAYLVEHAGAVVHKQELMQAIWPETAVEENNLNQNISLLRRALGEERGGHRYIATIPGRGYQFVAPVMVSGAQTVRLVADEIASIAVLPFVNVSADPVYDYFGDGLAEEVINALSKLAGVRVVARTSAFSFKGKQVDIREIAGRLGVNLVLEGSVRKSGNRLRITAQLVNAAGGYQLWSERYDREVDMRDIFGVQDEITLAVVDALKMKLPQAQRSAVLKHPTENIHAHELCLKGRFHVFRMTRSGIEAGISYFEKALEADASYALAQVGLAHAYRMFGLTLEMPTGEVGPKAKAAALKAIQLDDTLGEAHAVLAFSLIWFEWEWDASRRHFERALELDPNNAYSHWMYAHLCSNLGRHEEALAGIARARQLDPLSGLIHAMEGQFLLHAGRTNEALDRLCEALELDSKSRVAHIFTASAYIQKGRFGDAVEEARAARSLSPSNIHALAIEAYGNAKLGRQGQARDALAECLQLRKDRYISPYCIAIICNGLDRPGDALTWLERAFDERDPWMAFLKVEPKWKNLRGDPRFVCLLNRLNLLP
jgi:TolB-like protein/Tfp pilus assembly protein PilF